MRGDLIIDKPDDIYLLDAYEWQYFSLHDVIKMRNEPYQDMRDCIIGFDQRYGRFEDLNQSLSNVIIGYIISEGKEMFYTAGCQKWKAMWYFWGLW